MEKQVKQVQDEKFYLEKTLNLCKRTNSELTMQIEKANLDLKERIEALEAYKREVQNR